MVGFPPFVLEWSIDGQYVVTARCIDPNDEPFMKYFLYEWKLKGDNVSSVNMDWVQSTEPEKKLSITDKANKITVYMRPLNAEGIKGDPLFISFDATTPYIFHPSNSIYYLQGGYPVDYYTLEFYPNPLYEDKEALKNSEQLKIVSLIAKVHQNPSKNQYLYLDMPATNGSFPLKDICESSFFENWYNACSSGGYRELIVTFALRNKYDKVVIGKVLRCVYQKR